MVSVGTPCYTFKYLQFIKFYYVLCNPQDREPLFIEETLTLWSSKNTFFLR